ncbi:MAG: ABC transporter ATP-binding protein [Proteobacteria bacterium]|nr:ABC transporter ATP-binding protein [Pseudomonadota bacterium]
MLLEIDKFNLSFHLDTGQSQPEKKQVLFDISLTVGEQQTVAIVGESGSGKSVTALSVLRLLEHSSQVSCSGDIRFEGKDVFALLPQEIRALRGNRVAMIFQEPMTSLNPVYTIGNQLMEPLLLHRGMNKSEARQEAIKLLERTGIEEPASRMKAFPHQLSGGQRQRVMIAMALACRPSLLIADEPTTALDVTIQSQILELIKDLQEEFGMALLLITHDLGMVRQIADHVHIMKDGRIVEEGKTEDIFLHPADPYTIHLMNSIPQGHRSPKEINKPLININNLNCHFHIKDGWKGFMRRRHKTIRAVDQVSLTIHQGTTCGLVGESGSGKSTLGMALLKLVKSSGKIVFQGCDLQTLSSREMRPLRKKLQVVFQDPFSSLSPRLNVGQIIAEGMEVHSIGATRAERLKIVKETLVEVGLTVDMVHRYPHEFSGGQRQRIAIARSIVLQPDFLILDEPTSALDMTIQRQIIDLLKQLQERYGMTYLFISHDLRVVRAMADQVAVMQHGRIVEAGRADQLFESPRHAYTRRLFSAALGNH